MAATIDDTFVVQLATGEARKIASTTFGHLSWGPEGITGLNPEEIQRWSPDLAPGRNEKFPIDDIASRSASPDARRYVRSGKTAALVEAGTGASIPLGED